MEFGEIKMKRILIFLPLIIAIVAVSAISVSVVFADESEEDTSSVNKFASKVASILGLDETRVNDAIDQARRELIREATESKLNALVESGKMTQEEADEKMNSIKSNFDNMYSFGKHPFGSMGHHKSFWKSRDKKLWKHHDKELWKKKDKDVDIE